MKTKELLNKNKLNIYIPKGEERDTLNWVYKELEDMIQERNLTRRQFNDRTLVQFIDDSEKRVQGYVPSREAQGKEDWQSNVFNQSTRNKLKAIIASVASTPPDIKYKATSYDDGGLDLRRAEIIENLVNYSRYKTNPETEIFWEAWECATKGTVIKYDGYLQTKLKRKFIKSYDPITGDMKFEEKEVKVKDECIDILVPLQELYIKKFKVYDIQEQPSIAWVRYVDKCTAEDEFGHFKNWKYVKDKSTYRRTEGSQDTFFSDNWVSRVDEEEYEIIKYFNKSKDQYCIVINGVLLLDAPLLWGRTDKIYPFSKTIFEPFSSKEFFYGNSLPNANMDAQDSINALYNMAHDKTYRSFNPPRLVGMVNKDLMEFEEETTGMETTIYLNDVNQAKYMDVPGLNNSELAMIQWVSKGMDMGTVDQNQQGMVGTGGVTAREIVIANENAKRLKGLFFMFLTDLWVQKTKIRILNILTNYTAPKVKEIVGENGNVTYQESFRTFNIEGSELPDGSSGILAVQFVGDRKDMPKPTDIEIEEEYNSMKTGQKYNKVVITHDYLDNFDYDVQIIPDSIFQKDSAEAQAIIEQKLRVIATMFPEKFMANQDILFEDFVKSYNEVPEKYMGMPMINPIEAPVGNEQIPTEEQTAPGEPDEQMVGSQGGAGAEELLALRETINQLNQ